jgi:hypothetical protein
MPARAPAAPAFGFEVALCPAWVVGASDPLPATHKRCGQELDPRARPHHQNTGPPSFDGSCGARARGAPLALPAVARVSAVPSGTALQGAPLLSVGGRAQL